MAQLPNDVIDGIFHDGYMAGYDEGYQAAVKHGRWKIQGGGFVKCTACMTLSFNADTPEDWHYCPNCGARMDEEEVQA